MSFELPPDDPWVSRGYGQGAIEPGERPAVLVIDLQYAFTDPAFPMGGAALVERAVANTARVLEAARAAEVPVFQTVVAWRDDGSDIGLWPVKLPGLREVTLKSRWAQVDERVRDDSDVLLVKKWLPFSASRRKANRASPRSGGARPVHRRYAEVTSAGEVIAYLERVAAEVAA